MDAKPGTHFAPAERDDITRIFDDAQIINSAPNIREILDSLPIVVLILNEFRQMIFGNATYFSNKESEDYQSKLGLRPGELMGCIHASENSGGCGTSDSCKFCGAVNVVLESQKKGIKCQGEARLTTNDNNSYIAHDFNITASPWVIKNKVFTIVSFEDISEKRRKLALERIFFHDLLNKAGSLNCFVENLKVPTGSAGSESMFEMAFNLSSEILEEINAYRSILDAESGELYPSSSMISTRHVLENVKRQISLHAVSYEKQIKILPDTIDQFLHTDYYLINRVLMNMMKNALEATSRNGIVTVSCEKSGDAVLFFVHNDREMDEQAKYQVFQRSFSTKGSNRGLGTYSMKLLGERYLDGKISFVSEPGKGTTFYFEVGNLKKK